MLTTRMRVPRHSARAWRSSRLRIWKKREILSKYTFCLPMLSFWRLMRLWEDRRSGWRGFPERLWSWEDQAPLIEPGWAWPGLVPSLSSGPTLCTTPPCFHRRDSHTSFLTAPPLSPTFSLTLAYTHKHTLNIAIPVSSSADLIHHIPATWYFSLLNTYLSITAAYHPVIFHVPIFILLFCTFIISVKPVFLCICPIDFECMQFRTAFYIVPLFILFCSQYLS